MSESATSPVREGDLLAGKYRVEKVLGAGGMGIVVAARHEQLEQRVAIKFVRDEALGNEEAVERFLREARAAVKLKSEHVAKVLDVGTLESGAPYMVMEYLEGSDLAHVLIERGPASPELAAEWVVQACEALAEAHAAGIVHRDVKPQNLFLARTVGGASKVKVLDFGISKAVPLGSGAVGGLTSTRAMLGSPLYMSPEQMRSSREVDPRSDVWALGVVLFELLTCRWPYEADSIPELCLKVVSEPPADLAELRPDAPRAIVEIVERCLRREPGERYANAAELASALEPMVPPASRVIVERARMAVGMTSSASPALATVVSPQPASGAAPAREAMESARKVTAAPARTAPTPAAWGSGRSEAPALERRRGSPGWIVAGVVGAVAIAGAAVLALRGHPAAAPPESPAPSAAVAAAPPPRVTPPPPATSVASPPPAASAATGTSGSAPPSAAGSIVAATPPAPAASALATAAARRAPPVASARPAASSRPASPNRHGVRDDDIPSLR